MKRLVTIVILLVLTANISAQIIKKSVALAPISYSNKSANATYAENLYNFILNAMLQSQRMTIVERQGAFAEISKEKNLQSGVDFIDGEVVEQGKMIGAEYIIFVHLNNAIANTVKDKDGNIKGYDGEVSLFCRIVSVETGEVIASSIITPKGNEVLNDQMITYSNSSGKDVTGGIGLSAYSDSPEAAIRKDISKVEPHIEDFIYKTFPLEVRISDIQRIPDPKGKKDQIVVYITGGKSLGLKKGNTLEVKQIVDRKIGPKIYQEDLPIGKVKVIRVNQDLVSCKITSDKKLLTELFRQEPDRLKAVFISRSILDVFKK